MYDPNDYVGSVIRHVKKSRGHKKDMLRKIKQGDVDRLQRVSSIKNLNDESNTSFTYPKFNIFDNQ